MSVSFPTTEFVGAVWLGRPASEWRCSPVYEMSDGNSSPFDLISSKVNRRPEGIQII
ncbi:hypothetical protein WN944_015928 [Citrus x changshan-huyou]|uniref:Uncharacterized protein n=1 Tax=Citrus x changshan-huyou TaxID=2935761 RepID=A0AAP0MEV2_9ROSI